MFRAGIEESVQSRVVEPNFKLSHQFIFVCNSDLRHGWTPNRLFLKRRISDFGKMSAVVVLVTTENFNHAMRLVEEWNEAGIMVHLEFPKLKFRPKVGNSNNHLFYGLDVEDCYLPSANGWYAAPKLVELIHSFYEYDGLVMVSR